MAMPTQKYLKRLFKLKDGELYWRIVPGKHGKLGEKRANRLGHVCIGIDIHQEKDVIDSMLQTPSNTRKADTTVRSSGPPNLFDII